MSTNIRVLREFCYPLIRNMLEMQMTIFELIRDLEDIAEMGHQIRATVEEIIPSDNGTTAINAFLA